MYLETGKFNISTQCDPPIYANLSSMACCSEQKRSEKSQRDQRIMCATVYVEMLDV